MPARLPYHTIGHSTLSVDELAARLKAAGVTRLIDVRTIPRSRTNPQFNQDVLPPALAPHGIAYEAMASLGGRRSRQRNVAPEVNGFWDNRSFHNYADHALSAEFGEALRALRELGHEKRAAVMCAEAVWWRCHRRIIADYLLAAGEQVIHVLGPGSETPGSLSEGAVPENGLLTYPEPLSPAPEAESHRSSRAAFSRT